MIKYVKFYFPILIFFQSLTSVVLYGGIVVKKEFKELQNYKKSSKNNSRFFTPTQQLFDSLYWLPFRDKISYHKLILVYKILDNKNPDYLKKLCIPSSESHSRNLRSGSNNNLSVIRPKTNVMKKSFAYSSAVLWNKLSTNVKTKCFKYLKETSD